MPKPKQGFVERFREWIASRNPVQRTLNQAAEAAGAKPKPAYKPATDIPFGVRTDPNKPETMPKATRAAELAAMQVPPKKKPVPKPKPAK